MPYRPFQRRTKKAVNKKKRRPRRNGRSRFLRKEVRTIGRGLHEIYPPILRTRLTAVTPFTILNPMQVVSIDGNASFVIWRGNGLINVGPAQALAGVGFGAYAGNIPGGLNYLLGNFAPGGLITNTVNAPYYRFLVIKSWITVKFLEEFPGTNNHVIRAVLLPVNNDVQGTTTGISQGMANMREQNYSRDVLVPINQTSHAMVLKNSISLKKLYGINKNLTTDDVEFTGNFNTDPPSTFTWVFGVNNADTTGAAITLTCEAIVTYDCLFYNRNVMKSVTPT